MNNQFQKLRAKLGKSAEEIPVAHWETLSHHLNVEISNAKLKVIDFSESSGPQKGSRTAQKSMRTTTT